MPKKINLGNLYKTQVSLTEWFEVLKHNKISELRSEDNEKRQRLSVLNRIIKLPFDKPTRFPAIELVENSANFKTFFGKHKNELCALRLNPAKTNLPILRIRGITISKAMKWFKDQKVNPSFYKADFMPHGDNQKWSTIFIVAKNGIFGEIIKGGPHQLTQGFYDIGKPVTFLFNFKKLELSVKNIFLEKYLKNLFKLIKVSSLKKQKELKKELKSKFYNNHLAGYFETVDTKEFGLWFLDYNRVLGELYKGFKLNSSIAKKQRLELKGHVASHGKVTGKVKIIAASQLKSAIILKGEILVCNMTTPDFVPLMKLASAIITDFGGILSHAAIISRELGVPCIVGTQNATKILKNGDVIEVDTKNNGFIVWKSN